MLGLGKRKELQPDLAAQAEIERLAEIEKLERMAEVPFPAARVPERLVQPEKQRSYEEVAKSLGFTPTELIRAQLIEFFEHEGIKLYDYGQVSAWLSKKKEQAKAMNWCWRPLRGNDVITEYEWGIIWRSFGGADCFDGFYSSKQSGCRPYERLVPLHALEKVAKIQAKFGESVKFFVSDYASPAADPFIMVRPATPHTGELSEYNLVFDVWDEPGFGA